MSCAFPLCPRHPEKSSAYCLFHKKHYGNGVSVNMPVEIPKQSDQKKEDNKRLKKEYAVFLSKPENKNCKVQMEGCTRTATIVHHVAGRIGEQVFNQADWLASCPSCNVILESQDLLAREKGVKKSKFKPKQ